MTHFSTISLATAIMQLSVQDTKVEVSADTSPAGDWRELASMMLDELARAPRANWAFTEHIQPRADKDVPELPQATAEEVATEATGEAEPATDDDQAEINAMLDRLEQELDGVQAPSTPLPDPWQARDITYRLRPAVLLTVLRLAKTFGILDAFAAAVAGPSSLTALSALNDEDTRSEAADLLRGLIDKIILRPDPDAANGHVIELYGELGAILSLCGAQDGTKAKAHAVGVGVLQVTMVAGAGFEPAAFRL